MVKSRVLQVFAAIPLLAAASLPAQAQPNCFTHDKILDRFSAVYDEAPVARGLTQDGQMVQVLSTGDGKTWTLIVSKPGGETCVLMAGEGWRSATHKPKEPGLGT